MRLSGPRKQSYHSQLPRTDGRSEVDKRYIAIHHSVRDSMPWLATGWLASACLQQQCLCVVLRAAVSRCTCTEL